MMETNLNPTDLQELRFIRLKITSHYSILFSNQPNAVAEQMEANC